jgi:trk system potassium uptake protein TrkA
LNIKTINPIDLGIKSLKRMLILDNPNAVFEIDNNYEIIDFSVSKEKQVTVEYIEKKYNCKISCVVTDGVVCLPLKDQIIRNGDRVICTIHKIQSRKLYNSFAKGTLI